jgi:hypothetical protein
MNAPATVLAAEISPVKAVNVCQTVVVYEDVQAQVRAMEMASRLVTQFGEEPAFAFSSWNYKQLAEPALSLKAVAAAAVADIILLSAHGNDLPPVVGVWLELCARARMKTEGALALLLAEPFLLSASSGAVVARLQHAARLLRMDFLSLMPPPAERIIKSFQERSNLMAAAAMEIFDRPSCDHWGLNE